MPLSYRSLSESRLQDSVFKTLPRVDLSSLHAFEARQQFAAAVGRGEAGINLAEAALYAAAEDDALVSHSTVRLPVEAFLKRVTLISGDLSRTTLSRLAPGTSPEQVLEVIHGHLFRPSGLRIPDYGRSNTPAQSVLDHPGVWENPAQAYLHEVLIRKTGIAATLAILYTQVMQNLLTSGAISFAVRIDCTALDRLPEAQILHGIPREALLRPDGSILNTCSSAALVEMLRFLKRAFWPFPWETGDGATGGLTSGSGFRGAAEMALGQGSSAELEAISRTAKHRLERGIWTSTGGGDLRRARAACERLCLLIGDECPRERRDAAVILVHCGCHAQAAAELAAYASSREYRTAASADEKRLVERLLALLGTQERCELLSVAATLAMVPPVEGAALPLTW